MMGKVAKIIESQLLGSSMKVAYPVEWQSIRVTICRRHESCPHASVGDFRLGTGCE
jgi:hypothetical protein